MTESERYVLDLVPPRIIDVFWNPIQPTEHDSVSVYANISDISGINEVILSYNNGSGWKNITMTIYEEKENYVIYKVIIPPHPVNTEIKFKILAEDAYGNWAITQIYNFTFVSSKTQIPTFLNFEYLAIPVVIIVGAIVIFILRRKRMKKINSNLFFSIFI